MEEVGGADLVDTYLKSVGRYPMLKIDEEQHFVRMLEGGKAALKEIAFSSPLAIPRILALGQNVKQGLVKAQDVLRFPGEWSDSYEAEFMRLYSRLKRQLARGDMERVNSDHPRNESFVPGSGKDHQAYHVPWETVLNAGALR